MEGLNRELPKMDKEKFEAVPEATVEGITALVTERYVDSTPEDKVAMVNIIVAKLPEMLAEAKAKREEVKTVH
jgi:uncharacterized membrane protein